MSKRSTRPRPPPGNTNEIHLYAHCALCLESLPAGESASSWARLSIGSTPIGFQVWCTRHDVNVMHIDFEGAQHPANLSRRAGGGS